MPKSDEKYDFGAIEKNENVINYARSLISILSGVSAGILGVDGFIQGLAFYLASSSLLSICLYIRYFNSRVTFSRWNLLTDEVANSFTSFLLCWTLVNGICHVY